MRTYVSRSVASIFLISCCFFWLSGSPSAAADSAVAQAFKLYTTKQYPAAVIAFERIIRTSPPNARVYYYAALANRAAGKQSRARQLFEYIDQNFPGSQEAACCEQMLASTSSPAPATASADSAATESPPSDDSNELPDSVKSLLPEEMKPLLSTAAGRQAVKEALAAQGKNVEFVKKAEKSGALTREHTIAAAQTLSLNAPVKKPTGNDDHPFTAADIAKDGAHGIDQSRYPNCWFEASMAALAELPRGQRLLASMIHYRDKSYVVRFPGDGVEYVITPEDMRKSGMHDKAEWANVIECAQWKKFPDNKGANGEDGSLSRLEVGMGCITGCRALAIRPREVSDEELSSFICAAVTTHNPIVCCTYSDTTMIGQQLVVPTHAYTIIGIDPSRKLITVRNPWGRNPRASAENDPEHQSFQQLGDGIMKISFPLFRNMFVQVARSNI